MTRPCKDFEGWFYVFGTYCVDADSGPPARFDCQKERDDAGFEEKAKW